MGWFYYRTEKGNSIASSATMLQNYHPHPHSNLKTVVRTKSVYLLYTEVIKICPCGTIAYQGATFYICCLREQTQHE